MVEKETKQLILKRLQIIQDLKKELKLKQEIVKDVLENDVDYQALVKENDKTKKAKDSRKKELLQLSKIAEINLGIMETRKELSENKEVLSEELMVLYATEGITEITDLNGNTRQFKVSVKLS